jgi:hypothetical protein
MTELRLGNLRKATVTYGNLDFLRGRPVAGCWDWILDAGSWTVGRVIGGREFKVSA